MVLLSLNKILYIEELQNLKLQNYKEEIREIFDLVNEQPNNFFQNFVTFFIKFYKFRVFHMTIMTR